MGSNVGNVDQHFWSSAKSKIASTKYSDDECVSKLQVHSAGETSTCRLSVNKKAGVIEDESRESETERERKSCRPVSNVCVS
jgi:hypothetical protein